MIKPEDIVEYRLRIRNVVHVGANYGQERDYYNQIGAKNVIYIEPIPSVFESLKKHVEVVPGHIAIKAVCADVRGEEVEFNIADNEGQSSSMFPIGAHGIIHPNIVYADKFVAYTELVDDIVHSALPNDKIDLMNIDTQGADLKVLKGATKVLERANVVCIEVSEVPLYEGGCTIDEITTYLESFHFKPKRVHIHRYGWGDAVYIKRVPFVGQPVAPSVNLALGKSASQSSTSPHSTENDPQGAVDGVKNGSFGFHTDLEDLPWWQVDLGRVENINQIRIYNRLNIASERSSFIHVLVSFDAEEWILTHRQDGVDFGGIDGYPLLINLQRVRGRYVRVELPERGILHLDEVEVY